MTQPLTWSTLLAWDSILDSDGVTGLGHAGPVLVSIAGRAAYSLSVAVSQSHSLTVEVAS